MATVKDLRALLEGKNDNDVVEIAVQQANIIVKPAEVVEEEVKAE